MKKFFFSALIMGFVCLSATFIGCQSEESDFESTSKIEMLKAKSKELAKKYQVNVTLNDDSIAKYADQMTVESMEEDYRMFAEMKKALQNGEGQAKTIVQNKSLSRKAFLKRRKSETETVPKPDEKPVDSKSGVVESGGGINLYCCNNPMRYEGSASWKYNKGSFQCILTELRIYCTNSLCHSLADDHLCALCEGGISSPVYLNVAGHMMSGNADFIATGTASLSVCAYNFNSVLITVVCNEAINKNAISLNL